MLSRIVGKLEDAGLLHRRADPDDRRAALVEPTAAGRELQRHVRERAHAGCWPSGSARCPTDDADGAARRAARPRGARRRRSPDGRAHEGPRLTTLSDVRRQAFSSLANPNYRRYIRGQAVSLVGTWMQTIAQSLAGARAHRLGHRARRSSSPCRPCRRWCSARTRGVVADRIDKRRLMIGLQAMMGVLALVARPADDHRRRHALAGLRAGAAARDRQLLREPGAAVVRAGDGRARATCATPSASTPCMVNVARAVGPAIAGIVIASAASGCASCSTRRASSRWSSR